MSQSSYGPLFEALAHYNDKLLDMAKAQTERTAQALLQTNLDDLGQVLEQGSQQPWQLINAQMNWWQDQLKLMQHTLLKSAGQESEPVITPERSDRRFKDDAWHDQPLYDYLKQSYLLTARHLLASIDALEGLPQKNRERLRFFTRQYLNAMAPSNFLATNPELIRLTLASNGQNLVRGLALLTEDLERSADQLNIRLTDESAFELGRDLALTPGRVVQRTELYELIQYSPTTETVARTPVLIVPPFINKYYIMDMRPQNSLVAWLVAQGQTVFMISWRNPGTEQANIDLDDYVVDGVITALDGVEAATGEREVHGIGYCIGGTALSLAMGWLAARRQKQRVRSATLFTTLLDFSQPGEIGIFIHEPIIAALEAQNEAKGIMDGRQLAVSFSLLRENSLYWNYYIDSYLKGQSPVAFDLLHWNSDSTNVVGKTHSSLLRRLYLENQLVKGELKIRHTRIDLAKVKSPVLLVSAMDDHIAPWQGTWQGMKLFGGEQRFILAESGHIAGIINPPAANKYGFWHSDASSDTPAAWLAQATHQSGSWWPQMAAFIQAREEEATPVPARIPSEGLEAAPGGYVKVRLNPVFAKRPEAEPA
ncbi:class I poly(R)-hydroxyalkanoic acid synthase [Aeromonas sp. HMWF014]|uniref:class I poly(R)-hydroxyalkanoic acid synthase n=1 Tax=Aeromonas sp. HMWF014 TaxID=2056850 RepID=UPI000D35DE96|nr:class I poly(R)-hydroxyalkanoic acid synthase [Aeromonas sp. HMWF014]PTT51337.1 class I poly(R)-hydroxyalkanoic acid synthase [Aeromonas sp. HMWF014]